jgi:hypothetical protein
MNVKPRVAGAVFIAVAFALVATASLAQTPGPTPAPTPAPVPAQAQTPAPAPATAPTPTLDPALCANYAASAVKDFADTSLKPRCKRRENNRWHAGYGRHYHWCLTALIEPVKEEQKIRNGFLTRCSARAKIN